MRDQDKDLELPSFGPAEREPNIKLPGGKAQSEPSRHAVASRPQTAAEQPQRSGGSGLSYLIILMLVAVVAGLVYWNYMQHQQLLALEADRISMSEQVVELQKLFLVAGNSAAETGETLQSEVKKQAQTTQQKFTQLNADVAKSEAEIAKLWAITHQRNTPKIAALEAQLKGTQSQIETQVKALSGVSGQLAKLDKQLQTVQASESKNLQQVAAIRQNTAALSTEFQVLSESIEGRQAEQGKRLTALSKQVSALQGGQSSAAGLERRVKVNEQAVRAIDGSRLQVNKELLQIRQKLNYLQLKVEQL